MALRGLTRWRAGCRKSTRAVRRGSGSATLPNLYPEIECRLECRPELSIRHKAVRLRWMTRHCHNCAWEWTLAVQPGRSESCHRCGVDLRVCLNCVSYDLQAAYQCRDRRADPVPDKTTGNFCEYFDFARRIVAPKDK